MTVSEDERRLLLGWSNKQSRILTADGNANIYYKHFSEKECPHAYYDVTSMDVLCQQVPKNKQQRLQCCGAWERSLFVGEWEHTDARDERTFNLQSHSFFIDLRIPSSSKVLLPTKGITSIHQLSKHQVKLYARRHVFGGITLKDTTTNNNKDDEICTRLHIMDWNYAGIPRPRPNKWHVKFHPSSNSIWREYSFVTNPDTQQHYYMEQWESLLLNTLSSSSSSPNVVLVMTCESGIFIRIDHHFNYLLWDLNVTKKYQTQAKTKSIIQWIDACCDSNTHNDDDFQKVLHYLSTIDAAHGTVDTNTGDWKIDAAIQYWKDGTYIEPIQNIHGNSFDNLSIQWNNKVWKLRECSISSFEEFKLFLQRPPTCQDPHIISSSKL